MRAWPAIRGDLCKRWALEGRLISAALQALRLGTSVVLDYGLWGRDERSALRWLARSAGAACQVVYPAAGSPTIRTRMAAPGPCVRPGPATDGPGNDSPYCEPERCD